MQISRGFAIANFGPWSIRNWLRYGTQCGVKVMVNIGQQPFFLNFAFSHSHRIQYSKHKLASCIEAVPFPFLLGKFSKKKTVEDSGT